MAEKLVTIAQYTDYIEADLAKQMLEDFGIQAVVTGQNAANIYSGISAIEGPSLQVMESQAGEAMEILESAKSPPESRLADSQEYEEENDDEDEEETA
jgi:hypothetical protein